MCQAESSWLVGVGGLFIFFFFKINNAYPPLRYDARLGGSAGEGGDKVDGCVE